MSPPKMLMSEVVAKSLKEDSPTPVASQEPNNTLRSRLVPRIRQQPGYDADREHGTFRQPSSASNQSDPPTTAQESNTDSWRSNRGAGFSNIARGSQPGRSKEITDKNAGENRSRRAKVLGMDTWRKSDSTDPPHKTEPTRKGETASVRDAYKPAGSLDTRAGGSGQGNSEGRPPSFHGGFGAFNFNTAERNTASRSTTNAGLSQSNLTGAAGRDFAPGNRPVNTTVTHTAESKGEEEDQAPSSPSIDPGYVSGDSDDASPANVTGSLRGGMSLPYRTLWGRDVPEESQPTAKSGRRRCNIRRNSEAVEPELMPWEVEEETPKKSWLGGLDRHRVYKRKNKAWEVRQMKRAAVMEEVE